MKNLVLFSILFVSKFAFSSIATMGSQKQRVITGQLLETNGPMMKFDGSNFGITDATLTSELANSYGNAEVNQNGRKVLVSNSTGQYKLTWEREDFENGLGIRVNQIRYFKTDLKDSSRHPKIQVKTSTFDGEFLRSTTFCEGEKRNSGSDGEIFCATATKEVCDKVIAAYSKNDSLRTPGVGSNASRSIDKKNVSQCLATLNGYAEVLKAFSTNYEANAGVKRAREEIVKQDNKKVSQLLSEINDPSWKPKSINSLTGEGLVGQSDFDALSDKLTSSMHGLKQVNNFVDLCLNYRDDFGKGVQARLEERKSAPAQRK